MWTIIKRFLMFGSVTAAILITLQILCYGVAASFGLDLSGIQVWLPMYAVIGMGGAFIQLAISRWMAKRVYGAQVIDPRTSNPQERKIVEMVYSAAQKAKLPAMPEVAIYDSPEVNAFATGPSKSKSLVAVSTGLLHHMPEDAVEGVIGHEVAHIANGDMVTMTLIQGVINTMVMVAARLIAQLAANNVEERSRPWVYFAVSMAMQVVLSIFGTMLVAYFSRRREFRADAGGAKFAGRERMLSGLKSLRDVYGQVDENQQAIATLKISGHASSFVQLMSTHPPLEERIRRLETMAI